MARIAFGIDAGGTTIKGAAIDVRTGSLLSPVVVHPTPDPAEIGSVVETIGSTVDELRTVRRAGVQRLTTDPAPIGIALSADIRDDEHTSGVSPHPSWVSAPAKKLLERRIGGPVRLINDADAAGIAEMRFGIGKQGGRVLVVLTVGTWIGSAIFVDGALIPNSGLGLLPLKGGLAEELIGGRAREQRGISWSRWASEFSDYLLLIDRLLHPDSVILCGGVFEAGYGPVALPSAPFPVRVTRLGPGVGAIGAGAFAADAPTR